MAPPEGRDLASASLHGGSRDEKSGRGGGGSGGVPLVVRDPLSPMAEAYMQLGAIVVREIAKLELVEKNAVRCVPCVCAAFF